MTRVLVLVLVMVSSAFAETIAMLPLDTEKRLEIYSQPVASAIAKGLKDAGLDVVVVGAKMEVPANAQLIVDGSIKAGKGKEIALTIRIRDPRDGTTLENVPPVTTPLANIDKAAAELSAKVVPLVQTHLAELAKKAAEKPIVANPPTSVPTAPLAPFVIVSATAHAPKDASSALLTSALGTHLPGWAHEQRHEAKAVDWDALSRKKAGKTIEDNRSDVGLGFEVLSFRVSRNTNVPVAHAQVRVRIATPTGMKWERIVRTDSVVGDKGMTNDALAARTAREVLAIAVPHIRRTIPTWRAR